MNSVDLDALTLGQVQSVHAAFAADWIEVFDLRRAMEARSGPGMPGPAQVRRQLGRWRKILAG